MRSLRLTVVALVAPCIVVLAGCGGDDPAPTAIDTTPSAEESMTPDDDASSTPEETDSGDIDDFPDVDGFTYTELPGAAFKSLNTSLKDTPEIEGAAAKLVETEGDKAGLVMRVAVDPEAADMSDFEDTFLPAIAGGLAGNVATPDYEDINGTKVLTIETPDQTGTAYAWVEGSIATILIFKDSGDAATFAEAALS